MQFLPNPLDFNLNRTFKANVWQRTYTKHGRTLLALAFNYDILSLKMLQFGVEEMNVNVVDAPVGCFQFLSEVERIQIAMDLVLADFNFEEDFEPYLGLTDDDSCLLQSHPWRLRWLRPVQAQMLRYKFGMNTFSFFPFEIHRYKYWKKDSLKLVWIKIPCYL